MGGNIAGSTRMIPVIALERTKDGLGLARGLGFILTAITMLVSPAAFVLGKK